MESEVGHCPSFGGPPFGSPLDPIGFGCGPKGDGASIFDEGVDSLPTSSNNANNFSFQVGDDDVAPIATSTTAAATAMHAPSQAMALSRERHRVYVKSGVTVEVMEDHLLRHFSAFGNVTDVYIPRVVPSQVPKGFAYVSFDSEDAVLRVLELGSHEINGKHFPIGRAEPRPLERGVWHRDQGNNRRQLEYNPPYSTWGGQEPRSNGHPVHYSPPSSVSWGPPLGSNVDPPIDPPYNPEAPYYHTEEEPYGWMPGPPRGGPGNVNMMKRNACRIFVGGVPDVLVEEDMRMHFEKYGKVEDVYFPKEKETRKRRGFCYVRFDNPKAADAAAARSPRTIAGHEIGEIKIAQPRPGDTSYFDFHQNRSDYGYGGYGPQRMGNSYHSRSLEGRPPTRFRPY